MRATGLWCVQERMWDFNLREGVVLLEVVEEVGDKVGTRAW